MGWLNGDIPRKQAALLAASAIVFVFHDSIIQSHILETLTFSTLKNSREKCLFSFMGSWYLQKKQNFPAKRNCFCHDLVFLLQMGKRMEEAKHVSLLSYLFHSFLSFAPLF